MKFKHLNAASTGLILFTSGLFSGANSTVVDFTGNNRHNVIDGSNKLWDFGNLHSVGQTRAGPTVVNGSIDACDFGDSLSVNGDLFHL